MTNLGEELKKLRKDAGVTQGMLARRLRLNNGQSISNIERGIAPLPLRYVEVYAESLKVSRKDIIELMVAAYRRKLSE